MKNLILITILFSSLHAFSQTSGKMCGQTTPKFCIDDRVNYQGYNLIVTAVYVDDTYRVESSAYGKATAKADDLGVTKAGTCGKTTPKFCINDVVHFKGSKLTVTAIKSNGQYSIESSAYGKAVAVADELGITKAGECGKTTPKFCVDDVVDYNGHKLTVTAFRLSDGLYMIESSAYGKIAAKATEIGKIYSGKQNSQDSIDISMSTDTQDVVQSYQSLATVVTKERSDFLKFISANLSQANAGDVNIMAGMVLAKIVRLSTSEVVKQNFEKPMNNFLAEIAKANWKSIEQVEANIRTVDFASRVIAASVKLKIATSANETEKSDLAQLGQITGMTQLSRKIVALQDFCKSHEELMAELIQDPRHGALGMVTADIMQWVLNK